MIGLSRARWSASVGLMEARRPWYRISDLEMSEMSAPMNSAVAIFACLRGDGAMESYSMLIADVEVRNEIEVRNGS